MKYVTIATTYVLIVLLAISCTPTNLSYSEALDRNQRKLETDAQRRDASFLVEVANTNILLTTLSSRATQEGYARIVTDFAATALADHQRMHEDLRKLAKDRKIALPTTMSDQNQQIVNQLTTSDRRAFDKLYLNTVESVHGRAVRLFEDAALNANDSNIRAFAASKLDMIRTHSRKARELENQLL
jgi:putative membrane protein